MSVTLTSLNQEELRSKPYTAVPGLVVAAIDAVGAANKANDSDPTAVPLWRDAVREHLREAYAALSLARAHIEFNDKKRL